MEKPKKISCKAMADFIIATKKIIPRPGMVHTCGMNGEKANKTLFAAKLKENLKTDTGKPFRSFTNTKEK